MAACEGLPVSFTATFGSLASQTRCSAHGGLPSHPCEIRNATASRTVGATPTVTGTYWRCEESGQ